MTPQNFVVAVYYRDLAYGGPEEGGWYYEYGEKYSGIPEQSFPDRVSASGYRRLLQHSLNKHENNGRRRISSVLSEGDYQARVYPDEAPAHFPEQRPHYE